MNINEPDIELIRRCHDGEASAEELAAIESRLRGDAAFREAYVRYLNLDVALETAAAAVKPPKPRSATIRGDSPWKMWFSWRPLPMATGLVVGILSASVAWAVALPWLAEASMVVATIFTESFESNVMATLPGLPRDCGVWSGDEATVVMAEQGVSPRSGSKMLRFVSATYPGENSPRSQWGDVYRLVAVRSLSSEGRTIARLSASFAGVPAETGEQYFCRAEAIALDLDRSALPAPLLLPWARENASAAISRMVPLIGNRQWQDVSVEVPISLKTQFVLLHLVVFRELPVIASGAVRFRGHYLDDVKLELLAPRSVRGGGTVATK